MSLLSFEQRGTSIASNMSELVGCTPMVFLSDRVQHAAAAVAAALPASNGGAASGASATDTVIPANASAAPAVIAIKLELMNPLKSVKDRLGIAVIDQA